MMIAFRIVWGLLLAFVVFCMIQAVRRMWVYDEANTEVEKLRADVSSLRWMLAGWITLSAVWAIVRYI